MANKKAVKTGKTGKPGQDNEPEEKSKFDISRIKEFIREVRVEFEKIAWPDKKHTVASCLVVLVLVIILSFYLGAVDLVLGKLISLVIK